MQQKMNSLGYSQSICIIYGTEDCKQGGSLMYVIKQRDGTYFHKDGKIILFENEREINDFLNYFARYAVDRLVREGRQHEAMMAPMTIRSDSIVMPVDFDINTVPCGVIWAGDMRRG